jgi:hypothetical protein
LALALGAGGAGGQGYVLHQFDGANPLDFFGFPFAVAGAGDVDGDGVPDFLAGTPFADPGGIASAGQVKIFSGATGGRIRSLEGAVALGLLGFSAGSAGDLNGDGRADQVVGAAGASPGGVGGAGQVLVFSGADGSVLLALDGTDAGGALGFSVAGTGDVDGDGIADVAAGAPQTSVPGLNGAGRARVFSGAGGAVLHTFTGGSASAFLGFSVAGMGDWNGDGGVEVAVGAPLANAGSGPVGQVQVFSGLTGALLYAFNGTAIADGLGFRVAGAGDVNGDGVADGIGGAPGADPSGMPEAGQAFVWSGATGALLTALDGSASADFFGWSVAGVGDLDRDGLADVAVGAPFVDVGGFAGLIDAGQVRVFSGGNEILRLDGEAPFDEFGSALAAAGDPNGDGFPDLLVGAPFVEVGGNANVGQVRVWSGVGIPVGSLAFGTGCSGTGGIAPLVEASGGVPSIGNTTFGVVLAKALGGSQAFLFASDAPNVPGLVFAGCSIHILPTLAYPIVEVSRVSSVSGPAGVAGAGSAVKHVSIPNDPALHGLTVYFQWSVSDPASPNGGFVTSNALALTIP